MSDQNPESLKDLIRAEKDQLTWAKAKDVAIVALLGLAVKIFHSNITDINASISSLNVQMATYIEKTNNHDKQIEKIHNDIKALEKEKQDKPKN